MFEPEKRAAIRFIAVDWGTRNFRAYAIDTEGEIRQRAKANQGTERCQNESYLQTLRRLLGKWLNKYPKVPILLAGMIGADQGLQAIDCIDTPASFDDIVNHVERAVNHYLDRDVYIVPGIRTRNPHGYWEESRGEEVQVLGLMQQFPKHNEYVICLPGSLTKWFHVKKGAIINWYTFMTGEIYTLLTRQSTLAPNLEVGTFHSEEAVAKGIAASVENDHWLYQFYQTRLLCLAQEIAAVEIPSYMAGLLIGYEIKMAKTYFPDLKTLFLAAAPWLIDIYQQAANTYGITLSVAKNELITAAGLEQIYNSIQSDSRFLSHSHLENHSQPNFL